MDEPAADTAAVASVESFAEQARRRGETEREVVEWAIDELESQVAERDADLEEVLEYARRSRESLPDRHYRAYEAMAGVFDVDPDLYEAYVFAYSELCEELAGDDGRFEKHPQGCTNVLVEPAAVDPDGDRAGPLVLKNRDVAGQGTRPKSIVEQPPIDDYHGFLTVHTCGTISIFKGVNDRGLVAANTYIESNRSDVEPEEQLRNGTVIRVLLEECASVREARATLESYPTRRLMSQTLFLADEDGGVLLEVDPAAERIAAADGPIATRTNHFVLSESTETESSRTRRERALSLLEAAEPVDREDLWAIASDHEHGPGDDSICRHADPETDEPHAFGQLTTASAAVFEGGATEIELALGNPCEAARTRCAFGEEVPGDLRTGRRWLDRLR